MRHLRFIATTILIVLVPLGATAAQRTFVSAASGSDSNLCTRTAPCRNFNAAMALTDSGGELVVLDSGGYGAVSVTQPVLLAAPTGVHGAITAFTGDAINVNAPTASVTIRGLTLTGSGASDGIHVTNVATLVVENVSARGFSGAGFFSDTNGCYVSVRDSSFRDNAFGIEDTVGSAAMLSVDNVVVERNSVDGLLVTNTDAIVTNSVASANGQVGFLCSSNAHLTLEHCVSTHQTGVGHGGMFAGSGATLRFSNCTIVHNYNGVENGGGATVLSRLNNTIEDSTNPTLGTIGMYSAQ